MPSVEVCRDGIAMTLLNESGIWFVLNHEGVEIARFSVDLSEVKATLAGRLTLQFTDGIGNGVEVEGGKKGLRIRLEGEGHTPKICRISRDEVESITGTLEFGV